MSGKLFGSLLAGLAGAMLSFGAWAGEPKKSEVSKEFEPGSPDGLFHRLDKNHDGAITSDEIPPGAPERLKEFLQKADKNGDKKLTLDELKQAWKAGPPAMPWAGRERPRRAPDAGARPPEQPPVGPHRPPLARAEPSQAPGLKALFAAIDKNHDGSLSLDEFVAGMTEAHQRIGEHFRAAPGERPGQPGPGGTPGFGWGPGMGRPDFHAPFGAGWQHGPMGGPGPWHMQSAGCPCPRCNFGPPRQSAGAWYGPRPWGDGPHGGQGVQPWHSAGPWHGADGWDKGPGPRPMQPSPGQAGGPSDEHLRRLVARLVREELDKIVKEKAEATHARPGHPDSRPEPKK